MSYRGFYQIVCKQGHYVEQDAYEVSLTRWKCEVCGSEMKKHNSVDTTNSSGEEKGEGYIKKEVFLKN